MQDSAGFECSEPSPLLPYPWWIKVGFCLHFALEGRSVDVLHYWWEQIPNTKKNPCGSKLVSMTKEE